MHFRKSWLKWRTIVLDDPKLSHGAKAMALFLHTYMNDQNDMAWPSIETICLRFSLSNKTTIKHLTELVESHYLNKKKRFGTSCQYSIDYPSSVISPLMEEVHHSSVDSTLAVVEKLHTNKQVNKQVNKQRKTATFVAPSLEQVISYQQEKSLNLNPEQFIDFYESKGWLVGKVKMRDWKAAARGWSTREKSNGTNQKPVNESNHSAVMRRLANRIDNE